MLTLWNPFVPVKYSERKSFFDSLFDDTFTTVFQSMGVHQAKNEDGTLSISVDVPGVKESDINVHLSDGNVLTIKGERKTATSSYSINRSFSLPENCDPDTLKAELKDGVLTISLAEKPLPAAKEPKQIPISTK